MAGSKKDGFETDFLKLLFNNTDIAGIGDTGGLRGSVSATSFYIALYTVAPTDSTAGTEATYTGYARKAVARTTGGFTVSGNQVVNAAAVTFDECTADTQTVVAFAICKADVEAVDDQVMWADLTTNRDISAGIIPEFQASSLVATED